MKEISYDRIIKGPTLFSGLDDEMKTPWKRFYDCIFQDIKADEWDKVISAM